MASYASLPSKLPVHNGACRTLANLDVFDLIEATHARMSILFGEFEYLAMHGDSNAKLGIAKQIFLELKVHMQIVEEVFHPAVCAALGDPQAVARSLVRHAAARRLIAQLEAATATDERFDAKMMALGEYAIRDVEAEEAALFSRLRKAGIELEGVGTELAVRKNELISSMRQLKQGAASAGARSSVVAVVQQHVFEKGTEPAERVKHVNFKYPAHLRRSLGVVGQRPGMQRSVWKVADAVAGQV